MIIDRYDMILISYQLVIRVGSVIETGNLLALILGPFQSLF